MKVLVTRQGGQRLPQLEGAVSMGHVGISWHGEKDTDRGWNWPMRRTEIKMSLVRRPWLSFTWSWGSRSGAGLHSEHKGSHWLGLSRGGATTHLCYIVIHATVWILDGRVQPWGTGQVNKTLRKPTQTATRWEGGCGREARFLE